MAILYVSKLFTKTQDLHFLVFVLVSNSSLLSPALFESFFIRLGLNFLVLHLLQTVGLRLIVHDIANITVCYKWILRRLVAVNVLHLGRTDTCEENDLVFLEVHLGRKRWLPVLKIGLHGKSYNEPMAVLQKYLALTDLLNDTNSRT